jgi:hypothetical protein
VGAILGDRLRRLRGNFSIDLDAGPIETISCPPPPMCLPTGGDGGAGQVHLDGSVSAPDVPLFAIVQEGGLFGSVFPCVIASSNPNVCPFVQSGVYLAGAWDFLFCFGDAATVPDPLHPPVGTYGRIYALVGAVDAQCMAIPQAGGDQGMGTFIVTASTHVLEGSFDFTFSNQLHLVGDLVAPPCIGTAVCGGHCQTE